MKEPTISTNLFMIFFFFLHPYMNKGYNCGIMQHKFFQALSRYPPETLRTNVESTLIQRLPQDEQSNELPFSHLPNF